MKVECNTCHGVYDTIGPDGIAYAHVCPPLSEPEVAAAIKGGKVAAPSGPAFDAYRVAVLAAPPPVPTADAIAAQFLLQSTTFLRANARDENPGPPNKDGTPTIRAEGAGVKVLAPSPPRIVVVG